MMRATRCVNNVQTSRCAIQLRKMNQCEWHALHKCCTKSIPIGYIYTGRVRFIPPLLYVYDDTHTHKRHTLFKTTRPLELVPVRVSEWSEMYGRGRRLYGTGTRTGTGLPRGKPTYDVLSDCIWKKCGKIASGFVFDPIREKDRSDRIMWHRNRSQSSYFSFSHHIQVFNGTIVPRPLLQEVRLVRLVNVQL